MNIIKNIIKLIKYSVSSPLKYKTIDEAINGKSFDFGFLYNLELAKLKEMVEYFTKYGISADNDLYIKQMKLGIRLLEIIIEEGGYHFDDLRNYICDVKVNTKNADRFVKNEKEKEFYVNKYPHELYLIKAKYLYHKLRNDFEQTWWD